jgi:hypothetical protein
VRNVGTRDVVGLGSSGAPTEIRREVIRMCACSGRHYVLQHLIETEFA